MFDAEEANCATADPDLFFLEGNQWHLFPQVFDICAMCPLNKQCLNFALETDEQYGIWGGAGQGMRKRMHTERGYKQIHLENLKKRAKELTEIEQTTRFKGK